MSSFIQNILNSLESGSVYALAALAIIIIFKTSYTINFSQGVLGMFNAFIGTYFFIWTGLPTLLSALFGMIAAVIVGILIDLIFIRPAKNVGPVGKQIITLGLIIFFLGFGPMVFGRKPLVFGKFIQHGDVQLYGANITFNAILNISIGIILMFLLFYFLQNTKWGLAVRVTASNEYTAKLMGVPTKRVTMLAWATAASLGTLAALMIAPTATVNYGMMNEVQLIAFIACVLGGFQTFYGPVLAAYLIALSKNMLAFYVSSTWGDSLLYIIILIFIVFKPHGLIGKKHLKKV